MRPATRTDAEAVLELILARDVADVGHPDFTLEDVLADWSAPGVRLEQDCRVCNVAGRSSLATTGRRNAMSGYVLVKPDHFLDVYVHPEAEGRGLGTALREWGEARAAERGAERVMQFVAGANDRARELLRTAGYADAQHYFRMRAELAGVPAGAPAAVRPFEPARDAEAVHRVVQDAFAEIEGNVPETLAQWRAARVELPGFDPRLWLVLEDDAGVAGVALGRRWENGVGYVDQLAVAPRARARGHGRGLLLALLGAFRAAGLRAAELSVHGTNRGAARLYESVGMRPAWVAERWEKALAGP